MVESLQNNVITVTRTHLKQIKYILWSWTASLIVKPASNDNFFKLREINYLENIKSNSFPSSFKLTGLPSNKMTNRKSRNDQQKPTRNRGTCTINFPQYSISFLPLLFPCRFYLLIKKSLCVPGIELIADDNLEHWSNYWDGAVTERNTFLTFSNQLEYLWAAQRTSPYYI